MFSKLVLFPVFAFANIANGANIINSALRGVGLQKVPELSVHLGKGDERKIKEHLSMTPAQVAEFIQSVSDLMLRKQIVHSKEFRAPELWPASGRSDSNAESRNIAGSPTFETQHPELLHEKSVVFSAAAAAFYLLSGGVLPFVEPLIPFYQTITMDSTWLATERARDEGDSSQVFMDLFKGYLCNEEEAEQQCPICMEDYTRSGNQKKVRCCTGSVDSRKHHTCVSCRETIRTTGGNCPTCRRGMYYGRDYDLPKPVLSAECVSVIKSGLEYRPDDRPRLSEFNTRFSQACGKSNEKRESRGRSKSPAALRRRRSKGILANGGVPSKIRECMFVGFFLGFTINVCMFVGRCLFVGRS